MSIDLNDLKMMKLAKFNKRTRTCFINNMSGLSLIEILVTVLVLSIGLLGIAGMQAFGMRFNHDSYARSQATMIANELIERMHANPDAVSNGDYETAENTVDCSNVINDPAHGANPAPSCSGTDVCTVTEIATVDIFRMICGQYRAGPNALIGGTVNLLPNGALNIVCIDADPMDANPCTGDNTRTITVSWQDPNAKNDGTARLQVQIDASFL